MIRLAVRVHPRSSRARIRWDGDTLDVWVSAPPVEGAANLATRRVIAEWLGVPPSAVRLVAGQRARSKLVEVEGLNSLPANRCSR